MCGLLSALLVVSIMLNVSYQYSYEKDYLSEFAAEEESLDKLESNTDKAVLAAGDSGVYRYDQYGALPYDNTSMSVSYTHLDVYKRQIQQIMEEA